MSKKVVKKIDTPILLIVFNRVDTTQRLISALATIQPSQLYVFADGPRLDKTGESEQCQAVRELFKNLPWQCKLSTNFSDQNLGSGLGPATAIDWFFSQVEQGIILEDDILPSEAFFTFCQKMLKQFRLDLKIGSIGGFHFLNQLPIEGDYTFSKYTFTWGWATWRDRWQQFRFQVNNKDEIELSKWLKNQLLSWQEKVFWQLIIWQLRNHLLPDVWDYQWTLTHFKNNWKTVIPRASLVTNIGISHPQATHRSLLQSTKVPQENVQASFEKANEYSPQLDDQLFSSIHSWWKELVMMGKRLMTSRLFPTS